VFLSLIVLAPQVIHVLFGSQWAPAVLPFQVLCLAGIPRLILQVMIMATFVTGSSKTEVKRRMVMALLTLGGSFIGVRWGLPGVAAVVAIVAMIGLMSGIWQVHRLGLLRPIADVLKPQSIPFAAAALMAVVERASQAWTLSIGLNAFAVLAISLSIGSMAYLTAVALMRDEHVTRLFTEFAGDLVPVTERVPMLGTLARRFR